MTDNADVSKKDCNLEQWTFIIENSSSGKERHKTDKTTTWTLTSENWRNENKICWQQLFFKLLKLRLHRTNNNNRGPQNINGNSNDNSDDDDGDDDDVHKYISHGPPCNFTSSTFNKKK